MPHFRVMIVRDASVRERSQVVVDAADASAATADAREILQQLPDVLVWEPVGTTEPPSAPEIIETSPMSVPSRSEQEEATVRRNQAAEARRRRNS